MLAAQMKQDEGKENEDKYNETVQAGGDHAVGHDDDGVG
jgi:hypothetical protein